MAHIPFAFSISHFINSVGADAGFASIIGLAILVLLYFAQARETTTLRNRADEAEQRAGALEARLAQVSRAQSPQTQPAVAQRPAPARPVVNPAPGTVTAARGPGAPVAAAAAAIPAAPAGVAAPALTSATRLIPLPAVAAVAANAEAEETAVEAVPAPVAAAAAAPVPSAVVAESQAPAGEDSPNAPEPSTGAPRPATVAGAAAAASPSATAVFAGGNGPGAGNGPGPGTNGADRGDDEYSDEFTAVATQEPLPEPPPEPLPRVQLRPGGPGAPLGPSQQSIGRPGSPGGSSRLHRGFVVLLGILGVAAVAAVLLIVTSSGGNNTPASSSSTATTNTPAAHHRAKGKAAFAASGVSVGVLNGTAQAGLAAKVMNQLAGVGYKQAMTPANAANQTQPTTVVAFLPGQRAAALHVASALKLSASAVQPIDSQTQQIACPQANSCTVSVVVTVGQDLAGG